MIESTDKAVAKVLEAARRKLLDTGTRNRLVHVNRANTRANCLNIINMHARCRHGVTYRGKESDVGYFSPSPFPSPRL